VRRRAQAMSSRGAEDARQSEQGESGVIRTQRKKEVRISPISQQFLQIAEKGGAGCKMYSVEMAQLERDEQ